MNLLVSSSVGTPLKNEHVNDKVFPPLTISTSKLGKLFISAIGLSSICTSISSWLSSVSTVWLMLKETIIFSLSVSFDNSTSEPFSLTLKPSMLVGTFLKFPERFSSSISTLRNSTRSVSPVYRKLF